MTKNNIILYVVNGYVIDWHLFAVIGRVVSPWVKVRGNIVGVIDILSWIETPFRYSHYFSLSINNVYFSY